MPTESVCRSHQRSPPPVAAKPPETAAKVDELRGRIEGTYDLPASYTNYGQSIVNVAARRPRQPMLRPC